MGRRLSWGPSYQHLWKPKWKRDYQSQLRWATTEKDRFFAGHYGIATWGCGSNCLLGALVDRRSGVVYDLPVGEDEKSEVNVFDRDFKPDSRLLILTNQSYNASDCERVPKRYYFVIVDGGTFKLVKTIVYKGKNWGETKGDKPTLIDESKSWCARLPKGPVVKTAPAPPETEVMPGSILDPALGNPPTLLFK